MTGSEFVRRYGSSGQAAWENAALELAKNGELTPRKWTDITLSDGQNTAIIKVQNDFLAIGPANNSIRLPLSPTAAQNILNLSGSLLPTAHIVSQIHRNAPLKLNPTPLSPNRGPNLNQFYEHSRILDNQIRNSDSLPSGAKKHVIVSNIYRPGKVVIVGWYRPNGQFIQDKSNIHDSNYVDYSHGIQAVHGLSKVNGQTMLTADLYQHPTLSRLVLDEGPIRVTRYPSNVPVATAKDETNTLVWGLLGLSILGIGYYFWKKR